MSKEKRVDPVATPKHNQMCLGCVSFGVITHDGQIRYHTQRKKPPCSMEMLLGLKTLWFGTVFPPSGCGVSWCSALTVAQI